jgi:outer membrane protein TolC
MRLVGVALTLFGGLGAAQADVYTFDTLIKKVLRDHPQVQAAREDRGTYDQKRTELQLKWLPFGDFNFSITGLPVVKCQDNGTDLDSVNCIRTNNVDLLHGEGSVIDRSMFGGYALATSFSITQPIITSGKLEWATPLLEKTARRAGRAFLARDAGEVYELAADIYWHLKAARAASIIYDTVLITARDWTARTERELRGENNLGYTEGDLLRMKTTLINTQAEAERHRRVAEARLGALRALTDDPEAEIDNSDLALEPMLEKVDFAEALDSAGSRRPESTLINLLVDEGRGYYRLRLSEFLPNLGMQLGFSFGNAPNVDRPQRAFLPNWPNPEGVGIGFGMRQPLDFAVRAVRLQEAQADLRSRLYKREMYRGWIAIDVANAWSSLVEARERVAECERGERLSRSWFASVDEQLALGLISDGRVLVEVINAWVDFRVRRVWAIADANQRLAWLERTTGNLPGVHVGMQ